MLSCPVLFQTVYRDRNGLSPASLSMFIPTVNFKLSTVNCPSSVTSVLNSSSPHFKLRNQQLTTNNPKLCFLGFLSALCELCGEQIVFLNPYSRLFRPLCLRASVANPIFSVSCSLFAVSLRLPKKSTPLESTKSSLFFQITRGGGYSRSYAFSQVAGHRSRLHRSP
jgi:hypothetical protein